MLTRREKETLTDWALRSLSQTRVSDLLATDVRGVCEVEFATSDNYGEPCGHTASVSDWQERISYCSICWQNWISD